MNDTFLVLLFIILPLLGGGFGYWLNQKLKPIKEEKLNHEVRAEKAKIEESIRTSKFELNFLEAEKQKVSKEIIDKVENLSNTISQEKFVLQEVTNNEKELAEQAFLKYMEGLEFSMSETEAEFDEKMAELKVELDKMKSARLANIEAALREQEIKEQSNFYRVEVSPVDLEDICLLESIKPKLRRPDVLSKLIWTTYYQKNTTTMCNNVVGADVCCGIYKITDIETGLSYIGQSVDISKRWKDHIKSALGAGTTTASNKLYSAMQKNGVHNFTFEILERVPREQLNEKEQYWISFYESKRFGLNTVKGNL